MQYNGVKIVPSINDVGKNKHILISPKFNGLISNLVSYF